MFGWIIDARMPEICQVAVHFSYMWVLLIRYDPLSGLYGQNSVACMDLKTDLSTVKHSRMCPCIQPHLSCMQSERCTPLYFKHCALHNNDTDHTYNVMQDCMLYLVYYKHRNKHYYKSNLNFINFCSTNNYVGRDK